MLPPVSVTMALRVYNTATRWKEPLGPANGRVGMYVCGPTVYHHAHLGHAKAYVMADVIRRYLEYRGYETRLVLNFTDVEDAITLRARKEGVPPHELAERYIEAFYEDMDRLKVRRAHHYPRVTEHIEEIVAVVQDLVASGAAYVVEGDVFLGTAEGAYGTLSGRKPEEMAVEQIRGGGGRRSPLDFALWKRSKEGEPSWDSPWGRGRPGWHVECYTMATKYLGPSFDLHGGGRDLIFPHHESEALIAAAHGKGSFARLWFHNAFMTIEDERMAKSLGNFVTIRDVLHDVDWEALRFFVLKTHYRENSPYSEEALRAAEAEHGELESAIVRSRTDSEAERPGRDAAMEAAAERMREAFEEAMDDDFDTAGATEAVLELAREVNAAGPLPASTADAVFTGFCELCRVLGLCEEEFEE
ncbi:MAG: cysteine--tRNA ligase [Thermoplasmata archaeon]